MPKSSKIQQELTAISQSVAELTEQTPFYPPEPHYFEQIPTTILDKIRVMDEAPSLDFLKGIGKAPPFNIPQGYFEDFKAVIPNKTLNSAKVISIRTFLRYAIAACVLGIMATLTWMNDKEDVQMKSVTADLAFNNTYISIDAFESYLYDGALSDIPESITEENNEQINLLVEINKETIQEILQEIPENDISFYLDQDGYNESEIMN